MLKIAILIAVLAAPTAVEGAEAHSSMADYPPQALRYGWEGDVQARVVVGIDGRSKSCTIAQSSGHKVLDDATCELIMRRAKWKPATDDAGNLVEDVVMSPPIKWRLPK